MLALIHTSAKPLEVERMLPGDVHSYLTVAGGPAYILPATESSQSLKLVLRKQGLPKPIR